MAGADGSAISKLADAYRVRGITLARVDAGLRAKATKLLEQMERDLLALLSQSEIGDLTNAQKRRFAAMLSDAQDLIASAYGEASEQMLQDLEKLSGIEAGWVLKTFEASIGTKLLTTALSATQVATIAGETLIQGAPTAEWWQRAGDDVTRKFADTIRQGLALGETNGELVRRVRGTKAMGFKDGALRNATRRGAEALVRSSVQAVANETRVRFYRANDDLVKGTIYHATLDGRTTQQCAAMDGYRWNSDGSAAAGQGRQISYQQPPVHFGCRSTLLPWLKSFDDLGLTGIDLPPVTRSSMDGPQVLSESDGFESWLAKKPAEFQSDLIGAGKAKLFREGKIGLRDLVDQTGRPLTLAEVEQAL